ncbi:MAG TPA: aspartate/glutamate racemase family protein, partial [Solirubrobacterales bacterium]|nr:aspartate/glutamate racemase family protein [Solirubrobacterales bacterium]
MISAEQPVGMFDSGVGGLTVLHECLVSLPQEDFVYLGDTAMFPYGDKDPDELRRRIRRIAEMLLDRGAKLLVIACNTATSVGEEVTREVAAARGVEVVPVVEPQAEIAAAITVNARVGVLATPNTVESGAYRRALEAVGRGLDVIEVAAPDLAPFIQDGSLFDEETMA